MRLSLIDWKVMGDGVLSVGWMWCEGERTKGKRGIIVGRPGFSEKSGQVRKSGRLSTCVFLEETIP